jgi:hypothetical protein
VPAIVPLTRPGRARARAVSWARAAAHALHWPSGRAGMGTLPAVPNRGVPPAHGPFGNI